MCRVLVGRVGAIAEVPEPSGRRCIRSVGKVDRYRDFAGGRSGCEIGELPGVDVKSQRITRTGFSIEHPDRFQYCLVITNFFCVIPIHHQINGNIFRLICISPNSIPLLKFIDRFIERNDRNIPDISVVSPDFVDR